MALARLITRTPELALALARSLEGAGYSVEFLSPDDHATSPADLEVNLDDPSAASSYLVTPDGTEISFTYDPVEREFVLAPAWRRLKALVAPLLPAMRPTVVSGPVAEPQAAAPPMPAFYEAGGHAEAEAFDHSTEVDELENLDTTKVFASEVTDADAINTAILSNEIAPPSPAEQPRQSLYLNDSVTFESEPEPELVEFSSAEYFDGRGQRRTFDESTHEIAIVPSADIEPVDATTAPPVRAEPLTPRTPWLVIAAEKAEAARLAMMAKLHARRQDAIHHARRLRGYDESWLRAMPVAAIITIAFLLGWGFSGAQRTTSASPITHTASLPVEDAQQAAVIPPAVLKPVAVKTPIAMKPAPKPSPRRSHRVQSDEDDEVTQDVVVRHYPKHYPSKAISAANRKTVKRFSDID